LRNITFRRRIMNKKYIRQLRKLGACQEAINWFSEQTTPTAAWKSCQRGDWLLWFVGKTSGKPGSESRRKLVICVCECARLSLKHIPVGEDRPRIAIETAERYARREKGFTIDMVREAGDAAHAADAAAAAAAAYAAYAAHAAAHAAYAAYAAASSAYAAAYAAAAAAAAAYAAAAAARADIFGQCANIVRKHYPAP
jgi:hypothetical protein